MSGIIGGVGSKSGVIRDTSTQMVSLYYTPTVAKSGGSTDHYVVWNNTKAGYSKNYASWMSYSGADVTLKPGMYSIYFQITLDHVGTNTFWRERMFARDSGSSSPGNIISTSYGYMGGGAHGALTPLKQTLACDVDTIVKVATYDNSDGHSHYTGGSDIPGQYSYLEITKFDAPHGVSTTV